jgi:hypothetical protein
MNSISFDNREIVSACKLMVMEIIRHISLLTLLLSVPLNTNLNLLPEIFFFGELETRNSNLFSTPSCLAYISIETVQLPLKEQNLQSLIASEE